ncbi:MAG: Trk system potassium transporter TrkA [Opitutales bacterium]
MKILVVGAGDVGSYLSQRLSLEGHEVTVIEAASQAADQTDESFNVRVIQGNGSSASTLMRADAPKADFLLALTSDDTTNLVAGSLGKKLGVSATAARIHDETFSDNSVLNYQLHFGIDHLLNPEALCAVEIAKAIRNPGRVAVENFARGEIEMQQVRVSKRSKLTGKPLHELKLEGNVRIGYIQHEDSVTVPNADSVLEPNDLITLVGAPTAIFDLKTKFDPDTDKEPRRVVIFGGTETAIALVRLLKNPRFRIRIIEGREGTCRTLAERFGEVTIIHGSATSLRLMEEEQVGSADYFVACTKDDEDNIMTCLQAAQLGCPHVHLVLNKPDYEEVLGHIKSTIGIEQVVSPRVVTSSEMMRLISREPFLELARLAGSAAKVIQVTVENGSPAANKKIREVGWPRGSVVVALLHKYQAKVPGADDTILPGDRAVIIVQEEQLQTLLDLVS